MNYTADEIGNIPFTCPSDYPYKVTAIRTACIIRSANIICMWSFILFAVLWITVELYWDEDESDDEEATKNIQELSLTYEYLTIHESSSIPEFSCPSSYNYQPSSLLTFCYIRLTNLSCMWSLSGISILIGIIGIINYIKIGSHPSRVIKDNEILETTDVIDNDFTNFTSSGVSGEFIAYVENRSDNNLNNININESNVVNRSFENIARENNFNDIV
ncbi:10772_t:CDS:2 [Gigaspora margarita]|uniref:10772_t:CDS:1 n=1 Tax=Gigaspora margarita TaxID=4874 RepID=A0ABN7UZ71_GIGMA|nr:10772_t:CDS:2 [Gigaspora margarita]